MDVDFIVKLQSTLFIIGAPLVIIFAGEYSVAKSKKEKIKYGIPFFLGCLLFSLGILGFFYEIWVLR